MSTPSAIAVSQYARKRMSGLLLVILGGILCLAQLYAIRKSVAPLQGMDFRAVYGSSRCAIANCRPYDSEDIRAQFLEHGGSTAEALTPIYGPFQPYYVGYPPPTLFYFIPFALLPWPLAWYVYMGVALGLYAAAALLFADLCSEYVRIAATACLGLFLAVQYDIVLLGQPTLLAAALLCIGVWCLIKNRYLSIGVVSFAFSLIIKPHLGGLFLVYFLVATPAYRKRALQVIGLTVLLCLPALGWFSAHSATHNWVRDYKINLAGIAAPGNLSDPGPQHIYENQIIDLQTLVSLYRDEPSFYNSVVWAFSAVLIGIWLYPAIRRRASQEKDILCLAAIGILSMLPIYHRTYDTRALLILFPALALLMRRTLWWGRVATLATVSISLVLSTYYGNKTHPGNRVVLYLANHRMLQITVVHIIPLALLALTFFYLIILYVSPPSLALNVEVLPARIEESVR